LAACRELGQACNKVGDYDDSERYYERAREGYEEQFGRDSEEALDVAFDLVIRTTTMGDDERSEKLRDLLKRMERALGEEHLTTLDALWQLGAGLTLNDEYEEAKEVHERYLAVQMKLLGKDHLDTLETGRHLGENNEDLKNYEKALEYYERALEGLEKTLGRNHPEMLHTVMGMSRVFDVRSGDFGKAEELFQRALEGYEAQCGKDDKITKECAKNFEICLMQSGNDAERLEAL